MLPTTVQPTFAFHYCGGVLRSIGVMNGSLRASCCCAAETGAACSHSEDPLQRPADNDGATVRKLVKTCCSDYTIEISTDHFQTVQTESCFVLRPVSFLPCQSLNLSNCCRLPVQQYGFPPPGKFAGHKADLLTLICIFRI
jgi:hypothetical protein